MFIEKDDSHMIFCQHIYYYITSLVRALSLCANILMDCFAENVWEPISLFSQLLTSTLNCLDQILQLVCSGLDRLIGLQ